MATQTPRLKLTKPATSEPADINVLNGNFDKIDAAPGVTICTSTTRPSSPFVGQLIYETDSNLFYSYRSDSIWHPINYYEVFSSNSNTSAFSASVFLSTISVASRPFPRRANVHGRSTISVPAIGSGRAEWNFGVTTGQSSIGEAPAKTKQIFDSSNSNRVATAEVAYRGYAIPANTGVVFRMGWEWVSGGISLTPVAGASQEWSRFDVELFPEPTYG